MGERFPIILMYQGYIEKVFLVLIGISGMWALCGLFVFGLNHIFEKVLKTSPLARKMLPLLRYTVVLLIV